MTTSPMGEMERARPFKVYAIVVKRWGSAPVSFTVASTRSRAIAKNHASANDVGYQLAWTDFRATRRPDLDHMIEKYGTFSWSADHLAAMGTDGGKA